MGLVVPVSILCVIIFVLPISRSESANIDVCLYNNAATLLLSSCVRSFERRSQRSFKGSGNKFPSEFSSFFRVSLLGAEFHSGISMLVTPTTGFANPTTVCALMDWGSSLELTTLTGTDPNPHAVTNVLPIKRLFLCIRVFLRGSIILGPSQASPPFNRHWR